MSELHRLLPHLRASAIALIALTASQSAWAQAAADQSSGGVETITVTAEKRSENIAAVPETVSAVTAEQLKATGPVLGTGDLLQSIPGVRFNDLQSPNLGEVSIRGSGTERATGADSGVGLFVNGAYVGASVLGGRNFRNIDFFDLDRVEVIEGPQGALYGRNSEYGTVNIVLAKPTFSNTGSVEDSYTAGLGLNQATAIINRDLGDGFAFRVGAQVDSQTSGFYYNPDQNKYYDTTSGWQARAQLRYSHGPLDVDLLLDGENMTLPTFASDYDAPAHAYTTTIPLGYTTPNRFVVPDDGLDSLNQQEQRAMLLVTYDLGWASLQSTALASSWSSSQFYTSDIDLTEEAAFQTQGEPGIYPLNQTHTGVRDKTLYEDLHLTGTAFGDSLTWLAGGEVLVQRDNSAIMAQTNPCALTATSGICGGTPTLPICYELTSKSLACPAHYPLTYGSLNIVPQKYASEAFYGDLNYKVWDGLTVDGNFRYTNDHKTATQHNYALYSAAAPKNSSFVFNEDRPSYTVTVSYMIPESWNDLLYAKTGTGYRAGGVNSGVSSPFAPNPFQPTYSDETTTSYEAGLKGDITSNVYFTFDVYESRTGDAIASIGDGCTVLNACGQAGTQFNINTGTVHAKGVEAAVNSQWDLWGGSLELSANAADQNATYVKLAGHYSGLPVLGSPVAQIPHWTEAATFSYKHDIAGGFAGFVHVLYHGESGGGQDTVTATAPFTSLASINNVDLRTGIDFGGFELAFFAQNLTDERVPLLKLETVGIPLANRFNEPSTYGVDLTYKW